MEQAIVVDMDEDDDCIITKEVMAPIDLDEEGDEISDAIEAEVSYVHNAHSFSQPRRTVPISEEAAEAVRETVTKAYDSMQQYLETIPEAEAPSTLLTPLMPHQKQALYWLQKQEQMSLLQCGILADDMGVGKTIETLALMCANMVPCTLIVCPMTLLQHWQTEIATHIQRHAMRVCVYYGNARPQSIQELAAYNVVLTTYGTLSSEYKRLTKANLLKPDEMFTTPQSNVGGDKMTSRCLLFAVSWNRVILDEAHYIKNRSTATAKACLAIPGQRRFCLTGTPISNDLDDLYSLLRFCRFPDYGSHAEFRKDIITPVQDHKPAGYKNLSTLIRRCMLRRRKSQKLKGKPIIDLPPMENNILKLTFEEKDLLMYQSIERGILDQFNKMAAHGQAYVMRHYTHVLVLLLRLRQAACHPYLVAMGYQEEAAKTGAWNFDALELFTANMEDSLANAYKQVTVEGGGQLPEEEVLKRVSERVNLSFTPETSEMDETKGVLCSKCNLFVPNPLITPCRHFICHACVQSSPMKKCPKCGNLFGVLHGGPRLATDSDIQAAMAAPPQSPQVATPHVSPSKVPPSVQDEIILPRAQSAPLTASRPKQAPPKPSPPTLSPFYLSPAHTPPMTVKSEPSTIVKPEASATLATPQPIAVKSQPTSPHAAALEQKSPFKQGMALLRSVSTMDRPPVPNYANGMRSQIPLKSGDPNEQKEKAEKEKLAKTPRVISRSQSTVPATPSYVISNAKLQNSRFMPSLGGTPRPDPPKARSVPPPEEPTLFAPPVAPKIELPPASAPIIPSSDISEVVTASIKTESAAHGADNAMLISPASESTTSPVDSPTPSVPAASPRKVDLSAAPDQENPNAMPDVTPTVLTAAQAQGFLHSTEELFHMDVVAAPLHRPKSEPSKPQTKKRSAADANDHDDYLEPEDEEDIRNNPEEELMDDEDMENELAYGDGRRKKRKKQAEEKEPDVRPEELVQSFGKVVPILVPPTFRLTGEEARRSRATTELKRLSTKLSALLNALELIKQSESGDKIVIYSQFSRYLDVIEVPLRGWGWKIGRLDGSMNQEKRQESLDTFNRDPACRILIISLKAGGVGINLTVANHVFLMDPWWNTAVEKQAIDRVHRIGQHKKTYVTRFVVNKSVEDRILAIQSEKERLTDRALANHRDDQAQTSGLSFEQLCQLFTSSFTSKPAAASSSWNPRAPNFPSRQSNPL